MPKNEEHINNLRKEFLHSTLNPVEFTKEVEKLVLALQRPVFVYTHNQNSNPRASQISLYDSMLEIDEAVMKYAKWRMGVSEA